jgi:hypothetical protein
MARRKKSGWRLPLTDEGTGLCMTPQSVWLGAVRGGKPEALQAKGGVGMNLSIAAVNRRTDFDEEAETDEHEQQAQTTEE